MQTLDNALRLVPKEKPFGCGVRLQTEEDPAKPNPRFIPAAADVTRWMAERIGGVPPAASPRRCSTSRRPRTSSAAP